jgi:hypothetical protein
VPDAQHRLESIYVLIYDYGMGGIDLAVLGPQGFRPLHPLRPS